MSCECEKEQRLNLSDRIKLVNHTRNKTVKEFAEMLMEQAKPHYAINNCFCVDVAEIKRIEEELTIDCD